MQFSTKLSSSMTVARYMQLESVNDRKAISQFIIERFDERYFRPLENSLSKHGFTSMAIACLLIETLESFYQGVTDTNKVSAKMFRDFLSRNTALKALGNSGDWFYKDIRCGILHQGESRGGWRVLRSGPILDKKAKAINATKILCALRYEIQQYALIIQTDEQLWNNCCKKMKSVCDNCR